MNRRYVSIHSLSPHHQLARLALAHIQISPTALLVYVWDIKAHQQKYSMRNTKDAECQKFGLCTCHFLE